MGREDDQFTFDLLIPGYNYCGPFNPEDNGEPVNFTDAACQRHDKAYKKLGPWAYMYFNKADALLLEEIKDQTDIGAVIARAYFKRKRAWAALSDSPFPAHDAWTQEMGREEEKWKAWMKRGMDDQDYAEREARVGKKHKEEHDDSTHQPMYDGPPTPATSSTMNAEVSPDGSVRTRPPMNPRKLDMDSADSRRRPFNNWNGQSTMADKDTTPVVEGLRMAVAGPSKGSHETPITPHAPQYGLKETATVVIPYHCQATVVNAINHAANMTKLELRLNSPWDPVVTAVLNDPAASSAMNGGVYKVQIPRLDPTNGNWPATFGTGYPMPLSNTEKPWWREYWRKHYLVYAVTECEVTVTIRSLWKTQDHRNGVVVYGTDSYSTGNSNNKFPEDQAQYKYLRHWPGLKWKVIETQTDGTIPSATVIRFNYKPNTLNKPVTNDEDIKTWTANEAQPTLTESLVMFFGKDWTNSYNTTEPYAVDIDMRYIVQFKDLKKEIYYPNANVVSPAPGYSGDIVGNS